MGQFTFVFSVCGFCFPLQAILYPTCAVKIFFKNNKSKISNISRCEFISKNTLSFSILTPSGDNMGRYLYNLIKIFLCFNKYICEIAFDNHSEVLLHRTVEQLAFVIYLVMETFLYQYVQIPLSLINHKIFFFSVNIPNFNWYLTSDYRNTSL